MANVHMFSSSIHPLTGKCWECNIHPGKEVYFDRVGSKMMCDLCLLKMQKNFYENMKKEVDERLPGIMKEIQLLNVRSCFLLLLENKMKK